MASAHLCHIQCWHQCSMPWKTNDFNVLNTVSYITTINLCPLSFQSFNHFLHTHSQNKINSVKKRFRRAKNVRHVLWLLSKQWLIISTWKRFALVQQAKAQHVSVSTNLKTMKVHHTVITRQWVCQSLLINMNKEGWIKVFGLNLPWFLTWEREHGPASYSSYQNLLRDRVFKLLCVSLFLSWLDECDM